MSTLIIILAETRCHKTTWPNFKKHVLDIIPNCDLALCIGSQSETKKTQSVGTESAQTRTGFHDNAKHVWTFPEVDDWGDAFNYIAETVFQRPELKDKWRKLMEVKDQWLGGIKSLKEEHPGSAGILIFFRAFLLSMLAKHEKLPESNQEHLKQYDYYIITRSDYYYLADHPTHYLKGDTLEHKIYIPEGQDYQGITDRHIVVPRKHLINTLNLIDRIILDTDNLYDEMIDDETWNLEKYIKHHFTKNGLINNVERFKRVMFAIREPDVGSRWSMGYFEPRINMIVKYKEEFEEAYHNSLQLLTEETKSRLC